MAKRFTDTEKWKKKWFRELGSKLRDLRQFILDDCDLAGMWDIDLDRAAYHIGEEITLNEVKKAFNQDVQVLTDGSIHIPAFIEFQYGTLTETNNAHRAVLKRLRSKTIEPLTSPSRGLQDKDKDKDQDKDQEKDKDAHVKSSKGSYVSQGIHECVIEYQRTLDHFKIQRNAKSSEFKIATLGSRFGFEDLRLALAGMRREKRTDKFNPADHVSLDRLPKNFEKFINLGAKHGQPSSVEPCEGSDGANDSGSQIPPTGNQDTPPPEVLALLERTKAK